MVCKEGKKKGVKFMYREIFSIGKWEINTEKGRILVIDDNAEEAIMNKLGKHFRIEICNNLGGAFLKILEKIIAY